MKNLLLVASLVFSASAFAVDANSTWSDINASFKTDVHAPQVAFAAGEATSFVSIFDTCIDGDMIKTLEAKDIYSQNYISKGNVELVVVGQEILSTALSYTVMVPVSRNSEAMKSLEITIPVNNNIDVFAATATKYQEKTLLFTKTFTIPACK